MEDVLEVYQLPYDETRPAVCLDETSKQLVEHVRTPIPARPAVPGQIDKTSNEAVQQACTSIDARPAVPAKVDDTSSNATEQTSTRIAARPGVRRRIDDEYVRNGTANIFAAIEPITGRALVEVTEHRTAIDLARFLRRLSDETYVSAAIIVLVMDNLNTHSLSCLYEAFPPEEARRIAKRFEIHHTPKHGSWLNVAEIFLSMMSTQCLDQRVPNKLELCSIIEAWMSNKKCGKVDWRFTADDARIKLKRLYPSLP
jgi:hypothetical protein